MYCISMWTSYSVILCVTVVPLQSSRVSLNTLSKEYTGALRIQSWRERHDCSGVGLFRPFLFFFVEMVST